MQANAISVFALVALSDAHVVQMLSNSLATQILRMGPHTQRSLHNFIHAGVIVLKKNSITLFYMYSFVSLLFNIICHIVLMTLLSVDLRIQRIRAYFLPRNFF